MRSAIILAAGKGTRMKSELVKPMHKVLDKPMVEHIVDNLHMIAVDQVVTVIGYGAEAVRQHLQDKCSYAVQEELTGTGKAVTYATQLQELEGYTIVVNGDCPLIQPETYEMMFEAVQDCGMVVLSAIMEDPKAYGRIIRDETGSFLRIAEAKDCSPSELAVNEINTGIYAFDNQKLFAYSKLLKNDNAQNEYYITDLVDIFRQHGQRVKAVVIKDSDEAMGINDRVELYQASKWLQRKINYQWMRNGVTIIEPEMTFIGPDVKIGMDTIIYPNTFIEGKTVIGSGNTIRTGCYILNSAIGDRNIIDNARITDSRIGNDTRLGPWLHLRMNCLIHDGNRIGNFVEFKHTEFGGHSNCAHLTYCGDATIGKHVNLGCGMVTVNYDGVNKWHTTIEDDTFIGCNVNLIAPVTVKKGAVVAAGTTVTMDVDQGDMAIGRVRQENKTGYGIKYMDKEKIK
ncbi:MAG: bifunctional UDP-N-acetylglucosamine diphosphorylase/glucosamine-1-phosphate N-acetyltransferase GlmU [Erysipelotrichaceae bacterium]|nr:bifunctional UDP-N-acetylglucosamine diphosphorylase/glucosamine-1-phosphate N-acetyltransferase GlmU [Erysipelotrichaceae bacterium]